MQSLFILPSFKLLAPCFTTGAVSWQLCRDTGIGLALAQEMVGLHSDTIAAGSNGPTRTAVDCPSLAQFPGRPRGPRTFLTVRFWPAAAVAGTGKIDPKQSLTFFRKRTLVQLSQERLSQRRHSTLITALCFSTTRTMVTLGAAHANYRNDASARIETSLLKSTGFTRW